jgi:hypothetical protein
MSAVDLPGHAEDDFKDVRNRTRLHLACLQSDITSILKTLSADVLPVNALDVCSWSPLHYAVFGGRFNVVSLLLRHPRVVSFPADGGLVPLSFVARYTDLGILGESEHVLTASDVDKRRHVLKCRKRVSVFCDVLIRLATLARSASAHKAHEIEFVDDFLADTMHDGGQEGGKSVVMTTAMLVLNGAGCSAYAMRTVSALSTRADRTAACECLLKSTSNKAKTAFRAFVDGEQIASALTPTPAAAAVAVPASPALVTSSPNARRGSHSRALTPHAVGAVGRCLLLRVAHFVKVRTICARVATPRVCAQIAHHEPLPAMMLGKDWSHYAAPAPTNALVDEITTLLGQLCVYLLVDGALIEARPRAATSSPVSGSVSASATLAEASAARTEAVLMRCVYALAARARACAHTECARESDCAHADRCCHRPVALVTMACTRSVLCTNSIHCRCSVCIVMMSMHAHVLT